MKLTTSITLSASSMLRLLEHQPTDRFRAHVAQELASTLAHGIVTNFGDEFVGTTSLDTVPNIQFIGELYVFTKQQLDDYIDFVTRVDHTEE